jgi:hypothetical protein
MNDNELLIEKVKTQKILDDVAEHDLVKYVSDTHARIEALASRLELELTYGTPTKKAVAA